jgi:perosamine synthetase
MNLPLFDCRLDSAALAAMEPALSAGQLAAGPHNAQLEAALSTRVGGRPVVVLSDLTHALEAALRCAGVGRNPQDEVLTLSYNCMSSNAAISYVGARPVWVDIDPKHAAMRLPDVQMSITTNSRALMVYHVAGYPADIVGLRALCDEHSLILIEDANNALGATLPDGRSVGSVGDFAVFSFYANRNVNAIEGAALVCPDQGVADQVRTMRRFGIDQTRFRDLSGEIDAACDIPQIGLPATLPNAHAALALHQLEQLDGRLARTRANAASITRGLKDVPGVLPISPIEGGVSAYWAFLLLCERRDSVLDRLKKLGVGCSKLHQPNHVYSGFGVPAHDLPGTKSFMDGIIAVPCGWWMDKAACTALVEAVKEAVR